MKNILLLFHILLFSFFWSAAQKIHTPDEMLKIMKDSKVRYEYQELKKDIVTEDHNRLLNIDTFYRIKTEDGYKLYYYNLSATGRKYSDSAMNYNSLNKYEKAIKMFKKILETDTGYYPALTATGQAYFKLLNKDQALAFLQKSINKSYIDYNAHWQLALIYKSEGNFKDAVSEITIARILDRNNPKIISSFKAIYKAARLSCDDWEFNPQYRLTTGMDNSVIIEYKPEWIGYAFAKAVWTYEPGYSEAMGVRPNIFSNLEEKECIANLYFGILTNKKFIDKNPAFIPLKFAFNNDYINEYVFYEIILVGHPSFVYQLDQEFILKIKDYIIKTRGYKCKNMKY